MLYKFLAEFVRARSLEQFEQEIASGSEDLPGKLEGQFGEAQAARLIRGSHP
jgi:hypothetical protein